MDGFLFPEKFPETAHLTPTCNLPRKTWEKYHEYSLNVVGHGLKVKATRILINFGNQLKGKQPENPVGTFLIRVFSVGAPSGRGEVGKKPCLLPACAPYW